VLSRPSTARRPELLKGGRASGVDEDFSTDEIGRARRAIDEHLETVEMIEQQQRGQCGRPSPTRS
jgi:hypothetical protein